MTGIHMGDLLEQEIRRQDLNITDLAFALKVTRSTLNSWFKLEVLDEITIEKITGVINYDLYTIESKPIMPKHELLQSSLIKDEAYWQNKYINLLEQYAILLKANSK